MTTTSPAGSFIVLPAADALHICRSPSSGACLVALRLFAFRARGATIQELAALMGRPERTVRRWMRDLIDARLAAKLRPGFYVPTDHADEQTTFVDALDAVYRVTCPALRVHDAATRDRHVASTHAESDHTSASPRLVAATLDQRPAADVPPYKEQENTRVDVRSYEDIARLVPTESVRTWRDGDLLRVAFSRAPDERVRHALKRAGFKFDSGFDDAPSWVASSAPMPHTLWDAFHRVPDWQAQPDAPKAASHHDTIGWAASKYGVSREALEAALIVRFGDRLDDATAVDIHNAVQALEHEQAGGN